MKLQKRIALEPTLFIEVQENEQVYFYYEALSALLELINCEHKSGEALESERLTKRLLKVLDQAPPSVIAGALRLLQRDRALPWLIGIKHSRRSNKVEFTFTNTDRSETRSTLKQKSISKAKSNSQLFSREEVLALN